MKKIFVRLAIVSLLLSAAPAMAASLTGTQIQAIVSLLSSFGADQSVINNVQASLEGQPTSSAPCITINNNLYVDSTDATTNGEVTKLQQFLGGRITGYFGPATEQLVQNWQQTNGVVSSGSPDTTGFGYVGPKTRAAMAQGCNNGTNNQPAMSVGTPIITPQTSTAPSTAITPPTIPTPVTVSNGVGLAIILGEVSVTSTSAYISWSTNIPTNSKVFLNLTPITSSSPQVFPSIAGYSTQGFVNITNLPPNTEYSYTIEAINGIQDQKYTGLFTTNLQSPSTSTINSISYSAPSITTTPRSSYSLSPLSGASGVDWASFIISANAENVTLNSLAVRAVTSNAAGLQNGLIYLNGAQIGTSQNLTNDTDVIFNFSSPILLKAGQTNVLAIYANAKGTNGTDLPGGTAVTVSLDVGNQNGQGMSSLKYGNVPTSEISVNTTLAGPTFSATKYSGYGNQTTVAGSVGVEIGSFALIAANEGMNIDTIDVGFASDVSSTFTNLVLKDDSTGVQIGTAKTTPGTINQYSVNLTIPAAASKTIDIFSDVNATANPGPVNAILKADTSGTGATTGNSFSVGSDLPLQTMTIGQ